MTEIAERMPTAGERVAEQTLIAFSESSVQDPISTFRPDAESEIDLNQYKPGSIFRIQYMNLEPELETGQPAVRGMQYSWYVMGEQVMDPNTGENKVSFYNVTLPRQADNAPKNPKSTKA